jgi:hypothetical protein
VQTIQVIDPPFLEPHSEPPPSHLQYFIGRNEEEIELGKRRASVPGVGRKQEKLTPAQARQIEAALEAADKAERRWARLARRYGYSAVAREMGLTAEGVRKRVLRILGPP